MPPEGGILNVKVIWFSSPASSLGHQEFLDYDVLAIGKSDLVHAALQVAGWDVERVVDTRSCEPVVELGDEYTVHGEHVDVYPHVVGHLESQLAPIVRRVRLKVGHADRILACGEVAGTAHDARRMVGILATGKSGIITCIEAAFAVHFHRVSE